jgi:hypothetical protein
VEIATLEEATNADLTGCAKSLRHTASRRLAPRMSRARVSERRLQALVSTLSVCSLVHTDLARAG